MKAVSILVLAITFVTQGSHAYAQDGKKWRVYSPPRSGFSVETPAPLRKVMSFEGEHGASLEPDQQMKGASCYAAIETSPEESRFGIIVIGQRDRSSFLRLMSRNKLITALSVTFMTDDDRETEPVSERMVHTNGLTGREYIYSAIPTRGRIFDTGHKIYVLVFVGRDNKDLISPDAERFLNSLRLRRRMS